MDIWIKSLIKPIRLLCPAVLLVLSIPLLCRQVYAEPKKGTQPPVRPKLFLKIFEKKEIFSLKKRNILTKLYLSPSERGAFINSPPLKYPWSAAPLYVGFPKSWPVLKFYPRLFADLFLSLDFPGLSHISERLVRRLARGGELPFPWELFILSRALFFPSPLMFPLLDGKRTFEGIKFDRFLRYSTIRQLKRGSPPSGEFVPRLPDLFGLMDSLRRAVKLKVAGGVKPTVPKAPFGGKLAVPKAPFGGKLAVPKAPFGGKAAVPKAPFGGKFFWGMRDLYIRTYRGGGAFLGPELLRLEVELPDFSPREGEKPSSRPVSRALSRPVSKPREIWPPPMPERWPDDWPDQLPKERAKWDPKWDRAPAPPTEAIGRWLDRAEELFHKGKYSEALKFYRKVLKYYPWHYTALQRVAKIYSWTQKIEKARDAYNKILGYYPGDPDAIRGIADLHFWKKEFDRATFWYSQLLEEADLSTVKNLARAAKASGEEKLAKIAYLKLLTKDPGNFEAKSYLYPKPRMLVNAYTIQGFTPSSYFQQFQLSFGLRPWRELWLLASSEFRLRFYPQTTFFDLFFIFSGYWAPHFIPRLNLALDVGFSPIGQITPTLYINSDVSYSFYWVELHAGYRFFLFPLRKTHILAPAVSIHVQPVHIHVRYFLNINSLQEKLVLRHFVSGYVRWQIVQRFGVLLGAGGGNALDYLSEYAEPFLALYGIYSDLYTEQAFNIRFGIRWTVAFRQLLFFEYLYSREIFGLPSDNPREKNVVDTAVHSFLLGYRKYF